MYIEEDVDGGRWNVSKVEYRVMYLWLDEFMLSM